MAEDAECFLIFASWKYEDWSVWLFLFQLQSVLRILDLLVHAQAIRRLSSQSRYKSSKCPTIFLLNSRNCVSVTSGLCFGRRLDA